MQRVPFTTWQKNIENEESISMFMPILNS